MYYVHQSAYNYTVQADQAGSSLRYTFYHSHSRFLFINNADHYLCVEVARAPGAIRRQSAHKYAVPSNHV